MQRYKIRCNDCDPKITPHENGKWVRWGDVERLRAELAACRAALELIAAPQRSDGSWNRDREACRQVAQAALAAKEE